MMHGNNDTTSDLNTGGDHVPGRDVPSPIMRNILQTVERIAASDLGVLIVGEEGTEQEWLARKIHEMSSRTRGNFIRIDCFSRNMETLEKEIFGFEEPAFNAIDVTPSAFDDAAGGTIFLMNLSDLIPPLHVKLTRALLHQHYRHVGGQTEYPINVRVIATVARKPSAQSEERGVTKENFQRVCPVIINLPPLRERREDIPVLITRFLDELNQRPGTLPVSMHPAALEACRTYDWPGNALEVERAVIHAAALCDGHMIRKEHLPLQVAQILPNRRTQAITL
jgi:DNA-binding NtrC family response regulator